MEGLNSLSGKLKDRLGNESNSMSIDFSPHEATSTLRPFETNVNPNQLWKLIFTRDLYTISMSGANFISVSAVMSANGKPDFNEDMLLYGLGCENPISLPGLNCDSNEFMRDLVVDKIIDQLSNTIFNGANIVFKEASSGDFPGDAAQLPYNQWGLSQICIGGQSDIGALGCAFIDRGNEHQDNDALYNGSQPYNPGANLGVFSTAIFINEVNTWYLSVFRQTYDSLIPNRGVPVGEDETDLSILLDIDGTGPAVTGAAATRRDKIILAADRLARAIAVTTSHEMGHSMGLSVNGAMPNGLYGGDQPNFPGSTSNHLNLTALPEILFLPPSVNIMIPYTNFLWCNSPGTRFNKLNIAYLMEHVFYNP